MKKTNKDNKPQGRKGGYPSFKEIAYHHWRQNSLPMAGDLMDVEAGKEYVEDEEEMEGWQGEERRWDRDGRDDEPGEVS